MQNTKKSFTYILKNPHTPIKEYGDFGIYSIFGV